MKKSHGEHLTIIYDRGIKLHMFLIEIKLLKIERNKLLGVEITKLQKWSNDIIKYIHIGNKE